MSSGSTSKISAFALVFLVLTGVARFGSMRFPHLDNTPSLQDELPFPENQWYLAWEREINHRDHYVLYYNIGESIYHARRSDVLFLGNSRLLFALPYEVMSPFFRRVGLRYFNLAFGHGETNVFPMLIIRKFDLKPKIVVINADRFFTGRPSEFAQSVMSMYEGQDPHQVSSDNETTPQRRRLWEELKANLEVKTSFFVQDRLQTLYPYLIPGKRTLSESPRLYRSSVHGSWWALNWPSRSLPLVMRKVPAELSTTQIQLASAFQTEMKSRGASLVLMHVPANRASLSRATQLADALNAPLIAPELDSLTTSDGSHLSPESAKRFALAFLKEFENLPCFGRIAGKARRVFHQ